MGRKKVIMSSMLLSGITIIGMVLAGQSFAFIIFVALIGRGLPDTLEADVSRVLPDSPAAAAGIRDGDNIIAIDGQRLDAEPDQPDHRSHSTTATPIRPVLRWLCTTL